MTNSKLPTSTKKNRKHQRNINREIRQQQSRTDLILPHTSFSRLVHEVIGEFANDMYVRQDAVSALQTAAEDHLTDLFSESNRLAHYNGRETVHLNDMQFVNKKPLTQGALDDTEMEEETEMGMGMGMGMDAVPDVVPDVVPEVVY